MAKLIILSIALLVVMKMGFVVLSQNPNDAEVNRIANIQRQIDAAEMQEKYWNAYGQLKIQGLIK